MAAKTDFDTFCEQQHFITTGNCHMVAECHECRNIWNVATNAAVEKFTGAELLKAEIRAIHDALQEAAAENDHECFEDCLVRLRELSAV